MKRRAALLTLVALWATQLLPRQFATTSRLPNEVEPVEEVNFVPGWPFTAQLTGSAFF